MADVALTVTIPDAWVTKALDAFVKIADTHMTIEARSSAIDPADDFNGHWDFRIDDPGVLDTPAKKKAYGELVLRELGKAVINMVDKAEDTTRYRNEVAAVTPAESDVPDGVLI